jgi:predicted Fe-Mo cluster-binding NifX family protein
MRIAITSQNFKTITGHAGQTRRFIVYEANDAKEIHEVERIDLPKELTMHEYRGGEHPLFSLNLQAIVTQSAGQGFIQRVEQHGIKVLVTSESDPAVAIALVITGQPLPAADEREHVHACTCKL